MKRTRCERSVATPASSFQAGNPPDTARVNGEPAPAADGARSDTQQVPEPAPALSAAMQPMPFPGPYAYTAVPAVIGQEGARTGAATPAPQSANTVQSATRDPARSTRARQPYPLVNPDGLPLLILATRRCDLGEVDALLHSGDIDVNQLDGKYGSSALMFAAQEGHTAVLAAMLAAKANVNLANACNGATALMFAAYRGHAEVVRMLLKHPGIAIDQPNGVGTTALMCAAWNNKPDVVACLLAAGAQVNLADAGSGVTSLSRAAHSGHVDVVRMLLNQQGINVDQPSCAGNTPLVRAACNNKPDVVACLLAAGAQANLANAENGATALHCAAASGHLDVVRVLLKHPSMAIDQLDAGGNTALMRAAWNNRPDVVTCLLAAGAQANLAKAKNGATALAGAAHFGAVDVVRLLLTHPGINVDQLDDAGNTALMRAAWNNKPDAVACLLAAGASSTLVNFYGDTGLLYAIRATQAALIEHFLLHGAQLDGANVDFFPPLPGPNIAAIADLCAERDMPAPDLLASAQAHGFFRALISTLPEDGATQHMMRWLRSQGIRMACAQQMAAALSGAHAAWRLHRVSEKPANAQQQMTYCLGALGSLRVQGGNSKVLQVYRSAGISAAAIERLSGTASRQLENLVTLALEVAAEVGGNMLSGLVDACLAMTGLGHTVDARALQIRLTKDGYCAPVAQAIALGWRDALAALHEQRFAIPDGLTLGQATQLLHNQTAARAPTFFALEIQRQLDSRERLTLLRAMLGDSNDESLHALFQLQCDQLRQYCAQLLEEARPGALQASKD